MQMPININGRTDTSGAVSILPRNAKTVCVLAQKGSGTPTATIGQITLLTGTKDADEKFGGNADVVEYVKILISSGVSTIKAILVDTGVDTAALYETALNELMKDATIDIIVADVDTSTVQSKIKDHLDMAEAENMPRYAVFATPDTVATNEQYATFATSVNHSRIFIPGPRVLSSDGTTLSGKYAAVGLAGAIATQTEDPALPLNGVELSGFGGISRILLSAEAKALVNAGVTPLILSGDRPAIYRLVTSRTKDGANPDLVWQEGTVRFVADEVLKAVSTRLRANYPRTKNVARVLDSMRGDVIDVLTTCQDLEWIENLNTDLITVAKSKTDLYGAEIDYTFDVVTPLYNITINQHMKL